MGVGSAETSFRGVGGGHVTLHRLWSIAQSWSVTSVLISTIIAGSRIRLEHLPYLL
jgi:hypothetical protein